MRRMVLAFSLATALALGQYKCEPAGSPPSEVAPAIRDALQKDGVKIVGDNGSVVAEIWMRANAPEGSNNEENATLTNMPHGALLGVIRFPNQGTDRRGQAIKPGVYTMRLSFYPPDGAHQGVSPQRDFLLLVRAADDTDLNATPDYDQLVKMSAKAAGTSHPAILSIWKTDKAEANKLAKEGESDWVLHTTVGPVPVAIIVVGVYSG